RRPVRAWPRVGAPDTAEIETSGAATGGIGEHCECAADSPRRRAEALVWGDGQLGGAVHWSPQSPDHRAGERHLFAVGGRGDVDGGVTAVHTDTGARAGGSTGDGLQVRQRGTGLGPRLFG